MLGHAAAVLANSTVASPLVHPRLRARLLRRLGVEVGPGTRIMQGLELRPGRIVFGESCYINSGCSLDPGSAEIRIGRHVALGPRVVLAAATHALGGPERRAVGQEAAPIHIGDGSWLGAGVIVLAGVTIGAGCVVGAGAVVTGDLEPHGLYVGVPARRVRDLLSGP